MELLTTKEINGVALQCYRDATDSHDFWATREQIGQALEYTDPRDAIAKIHARNKDRLDQFSRVDKMSTPSGVQQTTLYNFKGLLEICRYSNQPKANAVMLDANKKHSDGTPVTQLKWNSSVSNKMKEGVHL